MTNIWCDTCPSLARSASTSIRAILHDPIMYPEPDSFKPERFINPDGSLRDDPVVSTIFGFGKRICPGRHLADATIFIVIASLLSVFNIKRGNDTNGGPDYYPFTGSGVTYVYCVSLVAWEEIEGLTSDAFLPSRPCPFAYSVTPRDRKAEESILSGSRP